MDMLTDKSIDLAAKHAAEYVRLMGRQEQERQELLRRHWTETRTLQLAERAGGEGLPYEAPTVTPVGNLFDLFGGVVRPPADAPPGVPMPVGTPPLGNFGSGSAVDRQDPPNPWADKVGGDR